MRKAALASLAGAGLIASMAIAGSASADPTDLNPAPFNGSGSDTTEVVMRALDAAIPNLASWDVTGGDWDTNGTAVAGCAFTTRTAGSGDGRRNLSNSSNLGDGCFQFARTSSRAVSQATAAVVGTYTAAQLPTPAVTVNQTPIALAEDGLTYVFRQGSSTPRDLTLGQLRAIYSCTFTGTVDGRLMSSPSIPNQPLIPTDASGSRADWLALVAQPTAGEVASDGGALPACIEDGPGDTGIPGGEYSEHNGNVLSNGRQIILHSLAQYIAQGRSSTGDLRGLSQLGYIDGNVPVEQLNSTAQILEPATASGAPVAFGDGAYFRLVFNNVVSGQAANPAVIDIFGERRGPDGVAGGGDADNTATAFTANRTQDIPVVNSGNATTGICNLDQIVRNNGFAPVC
jgi:hypothetical protein